MSDLIQFIKELGFPIFVAVFLLARIEPTLHRLDKSITALLEHLNTHK